MGIGVKHLYSGATAGIYDNWIEKTRGVGIKILSEAVSVYDNIILNCGDSGVTRTRAGIGIEKHNLTGETASIPQIYDNIIIKSVGNGVRGMDYYLSYGHLQRNIITESTGGERWGRGLTEATGDDANVYKDDTDLVGF